MKKYFITSDTHGFYSELKQALDESGFDIKNSEHTFVLCGDLFDRGTETLKLYRFIKSIPKERRILIKGNHEQLFFDLLNKKYPEDHDFHNGTVDTCCRIARMPSISEDITTAEYLESGYYFRSGMYYDTERIEPDCQECWNEIKKKVKRSVITKWLKSDEWVNYRELGKYILVHSFIPIHDAKPWLPSFYISGHDYSYKEDWRNSIDEEWQDAAWTCPWKLYEEGLFKQEEEKGKILVCGHWHTSDFYQHLVPAYEHIINVESCHIFRGTNWNKNIIGIDACTARTNRVNVLILSEDEIN